MSGVVFPVVQRLIDESLTDQSIRRSAILAGAAVPVVTQFVKAYTRGRGFDEYQVPNDELAAVITTASARLASNGSQISTSKQAGEYTTDLRSFFTGWTIAELFVLNRYRRRAM